MKKGFSLIEILVALSIVALLSVAATLGFSQQQKTSRDTARITDVGNLAIAVESYRGIYNAYPLNNGNYYSTSQLTILENQGLINTLPVDPKPSSGTATFPPPICSGYIYASPTNTSWGSGRQYAFWFGAELDRIGTKHPLNQTVIQADDSSCGGTRHTAYILGPKS